MNAVEDKVTSYKLEGNNGSSNQMDKMSDGELHVAKVVSGSIRHKHEPILDMLGWLKCVAIDHSKANSFKTSQESWMRNLSVRKVLYLICNEAPWRKRTFSLLQETGTASGNYSLDKPNSESRRKKGKNSVASHSKGRNGMIRTTPSSARRITFVDNLSQKRIPSGHSSQSDALGTENEVLMVLDSDDSANGSNPSCVKKPQVRSSQNRPSQNIPFKLLKSGNNDLIKQLRVIPYPDNNAKGSNSSSPNKEKSSKTLQSSDKSYEFIGDYLPRMAIPVGPRFQAVIPDVVHQNMDGSSDINGRLDDSKKWLGTRIWPNERAKAKISMELIGRGRPKSCLCNSPGAPECIRYHILAKILQLQVDISTAFISWKFDKMGEGVSNSWTHQEEKSFRILVKSNPVSKNMSFWEPALKCFPTKSRESIVSYYFNVFVLRRMRKQTRLVEVVDSDDDEFEDESDCGLSKEGHSVDVKKRYLTGRR